MKTGITQINERYNRFKLRQVMLTIFLDSSGIVYHEYAPARPTIDKEYNLRDAVRRKRSEMWAARNWRLHRDFTMTMHLLILLT